MGQWAQWAHGPIGPIKIYVKFLIYRIVEFFHKFMIFDETKKTRIEIPSRMPAESRRDLSFEAPSWKKRCHQ